MDHIFYLFIYFIIIFIIFWKVDLVEEALQTTLDLATPLAALEVSQPLNFACV
jgi:hypothetical protein